MQREQQVEVRWEGTCCIRSRKSQGPVWLEHSEQEGETPSHSTCYLALKWARVGRCGSLLSLINRGSRLRQLPLTPWGGRGGPKAALKKTEEEQNALWWRKSQTLFWAGGGWRTSLEAIPSTGLRRAGESEERGLLLQGSRPRLG